MSSAKPAWRQTFDSVERTIGAPLEELVASKTFTEVLVAGKKVGDAVDGAVRGVVRGALERALHAAQIPTRSDVRHLRSQLVALTGELRGLAMAQEEARRAGQQGDADPRPKEVGRDD